VKRPDVVEECDRSPPVVSAAATAIHQTRLLLVPTLLTSKKPLPHGAALVDSGRYDARVRKMLYTTSLGYVMTRVRPTPVSREYLRIGIFRGAESGIREILAMSEHSSATNRRCACRRQAWRRPLHAAGVERRRLLALEPTGVARLGVGVEVSRAMALVITNLLILGLAELCRLPSVKIRHFERGVLGRCAGLWSIAGAEEARLLSLLGRQAA